MNRMKADLQKQQALRKGQKLSHGTKPAGDKAKAQREATYSQLKSK